MIQFKRKKPEARATLEKANAMPSDPALTATGVLPNGSNFRPLVLMPDAWQRKLIEETLRKEAEGMILGKK